MPPRSLGRSRSSLPSIRLGGAEHERILLRQSVEIDNQDLWAAARAHAGIASTLVKAILGSYRAGRIAQNMLFEIYFVHFV